MMQEFYRLEQPRFSQYEYAFYEAADDSKYGDFQKCPKCEGPISMRKWLAPRKVHLKQATRIGDLVFGAGGGIMLVSERFKVAFENSNLRGIKEFNKVEIISIKPKTVSDSLQSIKLFEAVIVIQPIKVLFDFMDVDWCRKPPANHCKFCELSKGEYNSYQRIVIDPNSNFDSDIFCPINLSGTIILSSKAYDFFAKNSFTNVFLTPCSDASLSFGL